MRWSGTCRPMSKESGTESRAACANQRPAESSLYFPETLRILFGSRPCPFTVDSADERLAAATALSAHSDGSTLAAGVSTAQDVSGRGGPPLTERY